MKARIIEPSEALYVYHKGSAPRWNAQFFSKDIYSAGTEAKSNLALPKDPPKYRSKVEFTNPVVGYDAICAPAFRQLGGGRQTIIPSQRRRENPFTVLSRVTLKE